VFALRSGDELILVDAGYRSTARQVLGNLEKLRINGYPVRYILSTHDHFDHAAGIEDLREATGAIVVASEKGAKQLRQGGAGDVAMGDWMTYPKVKAVESIGDGASKQIGTLVVTAHLTPGHTPGCTSWSFDVVVDGKTVPALINCSLEALFFYDVSRGNSNYPGIVDDYTQTFSKLKDLKCDFFLAVHGKNFKLDAKRKKQMEAQKARVAIDNPFVAEKDCRDYNIAKEAEFLKKAKQR
jgi:metallo-beta-lactamase class B